jgi:hypothetical protein
LIEALFMIPYVDSVTEYRKIRVKLSAPDTSQVDLLESLNYGGRNSAGTAICQGILYRVVGFHFIAGLIGYGFNE